LSHAFLHQLPKLLGGEAFPMGWYETGPAHYFSIFVERAVMAPDLPKIDRDRHPDPGASEWYFRDEVLRRIFHGQ